MFPGNTSGIDPEKLVLVGSYIIYSGDIYVYIYISIYILYYIYIIFIYIKELFTSADPVQEQKERIREEM
jgi:Ca2+/Na+ antiporter